MKRAIIRLPGPNDGGDTWGMQWTEPGVVSPGPKYITVDIIDRHSNGDVTVELDNKQRRFTFDSSLSTDYTYKYKGKVDRDKQAQLISFMENIIAGDDTANTIKLMARTILSMLDDSYDTMNLVTNLVSVINGQYTDLEKTLALISMACIVSYELNN
jgi:hypothetical protein